MPQIIPQFKLDNNIKLLLCQFEFLLIVMINLHILKIIYQVGSIYIPCCIFVGFHADIRRIPENLQPIAIVIFSYHQIVGSGGQVRKNPAARSDCDRGAYKYVSPLRIAVRFSDSSA